MLVLGGKAGVVTLESVDDIRLVNSWRKSDRGMTC